MSLKKRLNTKKVDEDKKEKESSKEDPYLKLKIKIQNDVINNLDIDFDKLGKDPSKYKDDIQEIIN